MSPLDKRGGFIQGQRLWHKERHLWLLGWSADVCLRFYHRHPWLDRDTNPCLNFQRIGESMQRPLELCSWTNLKALPPIGKEYQQGYKRAPLGGRWLDRDTNACLNFQRIGESMQRPLELCSWKDREALPPIGKEYQQGYKRVNDRLPKFSLAKDPASLTTREVVENFCRNHERRMAQKMVEQRRKLPPMVNDRSLFTRAAPFNDKDDPFYHSPSNRIGSNYSPASWRAAAILFEQYPQDPHAPRTRTPPPSLGELRSPHTSSKPLSPRPPLAGSPGSTLMAASTGSSPHSKPSPGSPHRPGANGVGLKRVSPDSPLDGPAEGRNGAPGAKAARLALGTENPTQLVDAILRYYYYIELGVDASRHVAPFREEWAGNALALVPADPPSHVSVQYYDALVRSSLEEMAGEYVYAMKKAMVEYIIKSPVERTRLNLQPLEPLLELASPLQESHRAVVERQLPASWHHNVDTAREEVAWTLQTLSVNALELSRLWQASGFANSLLVDVARPDFRSQLPMQADAFRQYQTEVVEVLKSQLWTSWAPKSVEIFNRLPPVFINGDAEAYYRSVATLQGNQLRSLVSRSLDAYVAFFQAHQPVAQVDPQQDQLVWSTTPVFVLELVEQDGHPAFRPTFTECEEVVQSVLDNTVLAVAGLPRVGSSLTGATPGYTAQEGRGGGLSAGGGALAPGGLHSSVVPSTWLTEEAVVKARKAVLSIMEGNQVAPRALAALFNEWMYVIGEEAEQQVAAFAERVPEPSLTEYQAEVNRLRHAAHTINHLCANSVRT
ncbi:hypothetical protein QJQ45_014736, partial [Haematococcus lacustris]